MSLSPGRLALALLLLGGALLIPGCDGGDRAHPPQQPCLECHDADRQRPSFPSHLTAGFPTVCEQCHSKQAWSPASFDHQPPLVGKHLEISCQSCHSRSPVPTTCLGCHEKDRPRPKFPDHLTPGFSTDCAACHTPAGWQPAKFDHDKYPLTGKHATIPCLSCHKLEPLPQTCFGCHQGARALAASPNHLDPSFPTDCARCHSTAGWKPSSFKHAFVISSGPHSKTGCAPCHTDPDQPQAVTCLTCHHTQAETDPKHSEVAGYSYQTAACLKCHPDGTRGED